MCVSLLVYTTFSMPHDTGVQNFLYTTCYWCTPRSLYHMILVYTTFSIPHDVYVVSQQLLGCHQWSIMVHSELYLGQLCSIFRFQCSVLSTFACLLCSVFRCQRSVLSAFACLLCSIFRCQCGVLSTFACLLCSIFRFQCNLLSNIVYLFVLFIFANALSILRLAASSFPDLKYIQDHIQIIVSLTSR